MPELKKQTEELGLTKHVTFTDYIEDHADIEAMLVTAAAAVALYNEREPNGERSFTWFADPGKLKAYLAGGLPVVLTDVPYNAQDIEHHECGHIASTDPDEIAERVITLLSDTERLATYRENAKHYASKYDWNTIFLNILNVGTDNFL